MHVALLQPQPVHRREMADRIALVGVLDQLRLGGGAGGEVQQQRCVRRRRPVRREDGGGAVGVLVMHPTGGRLADGDPRVVALDLGELAGIARSCDDVADVAALEAVEQLVVADHRRCRHDDGAELDRRQHHLPERHDVAEHQQEAVAAADTVAAQEIGHLVGALGEFAERQLRLARVAGRHPQRRPVVAAGVDVEPVERPVEGLELGPAKAGVRPVIVLAVGDEELACLPKCVCRRHRCHLHPFGRPVGRVAGDSRVPPGYGQKYSRSGISPRGLCAPAPVIARPVARRGAAAVRARRTGGPDRAAPTSDGRRP